MITERFYNKIIVEDLILKQNYQTIMQLPKVNKIVINTTSRLIINDKKNIIPTLLALELITGQKWKLTKAKKSIATFKLRENQIMGCKTTLRGSKKSFFFEKLIKIVLPRLTSSRGITAQYTGLYSYSLDKKGNINLGISNILLFTELEPFFDCFEYVNGINICIEMSNKVGAALPIFDGSCAALPIKDGSCAYSLAAHQRRVSAARSAAAPLVSENRVKKSMELFLSSFQLPLKKVS